MAKKTAESQFADRLAQGDKAWKKAPVGGFKVCPVGHHTMVLEEAKIVESKQKQELFLAIKYVIRIGEHKGQKADEMFSLDNEERLGWLKGRIEDLGYEVPDSKAGIEEIAADLTREKPAVVADVSHFTSETTGKVYANINNLVLIDNKDLAAELASEPEEEPEDEPEAEADGDEPEAETDGEIEVGSTVSFEDAEGDEYQGEVLEIDDEEATVKDSDGGKWNIPLDELTLVEEEAEEAEEPEEDEEPAEDDEQKTKLCTIADAHDCEVDEDDDVDDIIEAMKKKTWKAKKLADDEIAVLKEAGIKVVKATAKKAAKKTAKKAKKKGAKKKGAKKR